MTAVSPVAWGWPAMGSVHLRAPLGGTAASPPGALGKIRRRPFLPRLLSCVPEHSLETPGFSEQAASANNRRCLRRDGAPAGVGPLRRARHGHSQDP